MARPYRAARAFAVADMAEISANVPMRRGGLGGDLFWTKKFCRPPRFGRTGGVARSRFRRFGIRTELVAIIPLAATLPGCILGQRSSARGARHQSIMHLILRNLAGSQTLRPTGWFLADEAMKPRRSRLRRHFGRGWGVRFLDRRRHPYLTAPPQPSAQGERAADARADSSSHEHALAASDAGRVVNDVDDHSHGIAAPLHRVDAGARPIAPLVAS